MKSLCPLLSIFGVFVAHLAASALAAEKSGPQVGEKITPFTIRGVLDDEAGKNIDLVKDAAGKPLVLFFIHERTRPSIGLARLVLNEAADRSVRHPAFRRTHGWVRVTSTFAMAFALLDDRPAAAALFTALGDLGSDRPWDYLGDPGPTIVKYRKRAGGGGT